MKMKFGAIVVDGRGKIGGHVASKNRAGSYLRTKVTPVNPQTAYQTAVRNRLSGISSGWRALTAAVRSAWNSAVSDYAKTDIFGDLRNPTGFNLYQRLNNNALTVGAAAIATPPAVAAVPSFATFSATVEDATVAEDVELVFTEAIAATESVKVFATAPLSPGVSFVKSEYRLVAILTNADTTPHDLTADYVAKFGGTGTVGQKVFFKMSQVTDLTGIEGSPISASAIVTASA